MKEEQYLKLIDSIKNGYTLIDNLKISIATDLLELENMYKTDAIDSEYHSFKTLLLDLIGRSYSRVLPLLRIARYMEKYNILGSELLNIPISHIEIVAKADVKWSKETKYNLENHPYNILKEFYN